MSPLCPWPRCCPVHAAQCQDQRRASCRLPRLHVGAPTRNWLAVQTIGVWGDIGHTPNSTDTRNHLLANNPAIVYNTADFVYAGELLSCFDTILALPAVAALGSMCSCLGTCPAHISRSQLVASASARAASETLRAAGVQIITRRPSRSARTMATIRPSPMQVRSLGSLLGLGSSVDCACTLSDATAQLCVPSYMHVIVGLYPMHPYVIAVQVEKSIAGPGSQADSCDPGS